MRRALWVGLLTACGTPGPPTNETPAESLARCTAEFSVANGFGHEGDAFGSACAVPPNQPDYQCPPVTPASIAAECDAAGFPCPGEFITRDAAVCIASADGLDDGLEGPFGDLVYNYGHNRPLWAVSNVTNTERTEGLTTLIDALDGTVLERSIWLRAF